MTVDHAMAHSKSTQVNTTQIASTSYWQPGIYMYIRWSTHTHHNLLETWQIYVPTLGNTYPAKVTGNLANIFTYAGQHVPSTTYWQPGIYMYLPWATHIQNKLLASWKIPVPTLGTRDTQEKLLATCQIYVPTLGNTDT